MSLYMIVSKSQVQLEEFTQPSSKGIAMKNMSKMPKSAKMPSKPTKTPPPPMTKKPTDIAKRPAGKAGIMKMDKHMKI